MQTLAPPFGVNNPNGRTTADVLAALVGRTGARRFTFRYRLLDKTGAVVQDLDNVRSCTVEQNWASDVKRTASLQVRDTGVIDFLSDRIQPWVCLGLPPFGFDDWVQWPQGVFLLSSPARSANEARQVLRDVDAYDLCQLFADDAVTARFTVAKNANYITAVTGLLGAVPKNVTASTKTLPAAKEWDPGTSKLQIINELLAAVNYDPLHFTETGIARVTPYETPEQRGAEYRYADDQDSVILPDVEQSLDLFSIPNKWTMVVSDPDRVALTSTYTNTNPASSTSTVRRGRTIVDFESGSDAADQAALDALVRKKAFKASQVFEEVQFTTGLMPIHSGDDVYTLDYGPLAIAAKYHEQSWSMPLKTGATMRHTARRVVQI